MDELHRRGDEGEQEGCHSVDDVADGRLGEEDACETEDWDDALEDIKIVDFRDVNVEGDECKAEKVMVEEGSKGWKDAVLEGEEVADNIGACVGEVEHDETGDDHVFNGIYSFGKTNIGLDYGVNDEHGSTSKKLSYWETRQIGNRGMANRGNGKVMAAATSVKVVMRKKKLSKEGQKMFLVALV